MKYKTLNKMVVFLFIVVSGLGAQPEPGDVYKEYSLVPANWHWRVTDPNTSSSGAFEFLPNPKLKIDVDDLDGATKAELVIDRWGGHPGTIGKAMRVNSNDWMKVPERERTFEKTGLNYYVYQDNPIVEIPLEQLAEGENILEGKCDGQGCAGCGWGQWGWFGMRLRIYYDSSKPHPEGQIVSPQSGDTVFENPLISVSAESANSAVRSVRIIGYYEGIDVDGDGVFKEWQRRYNFATLDNIVGTATEAPYEVEWDTRYVPDQQPGEVKFLARIVDENGYWSVTEVVENITLERDTTAVRMFVPHSVPDDFIARAGKTLSAWVRIDSMYSLSQATEAAVHLRTWNGSGQNVWINTDNEKSINGLSHDFYYDIAEVPAEWLKQSSNRVHFHSDTQHHGIEVLWPGPVITVRYNLNIPVGSLCDIDGSGSADLDDLIAFVLLSRREPENSHLDWDNDGRFTIADVVALLLDINNETCPETAAKVSLSSAGTTSGISREELDYLQEILDKLDLKSAERSYLERRLEELFQSIELPRAGGLSLHQNYPNPFNPSTSISFTIGSGGTDVSLKIYDIRGSLVKTLVDGFRDEGTYTSYWGGADSRGRNLSSGVYIYRLQTSEKSLIRKMVLLK